MTHTPPPITCFHCRNRIPYGDIHFYYMRQPLCESCFDAINQTAKAFGMQRDDLNIPIQEATR